MINKNKQLPHGHRQDPVHKDKMLNKYGVTDKEEQFCQAYLIDFNISKAARLAGFAESGACISGKKLLSKTRVRKRIAQIRLDTGKAFDITRERLLQELMAIVYADPRNIIDKPVDLWDDEEAAAVSGVEYDLLGDIKTVKRWDKLKAIEMLNKMLGYNMPETVLNKNVNINAGELSKEDAIRISKQLKDNL